jgi:predicted nucleotidyltransferase
MNGSLAFLQDNERQALAEYVGRLLAVESRRIQNVVLFGSKARGDANADSDLDVLVIVDGYDSQTDHLVTKTAARVSLEYDTLLNTHIVTADRWDQMRQWAATLWQQVQRDGVPLLPESTLA